MISPSSSLSSRRRSRRSKTNGRYAPVVQKMVLVVSCLVGIGGFYSFCGLSVLLLPSSSHAFSMVSPTKPLARRTVTGSNHNGQNGNTNTDSNSNSNSNSNSALCMAPKSPQPRQPRRMLKKRTPKDGDRRRRNSRRRNASTAVDSSGAGHPQRTAPGILGGGNNSNNKQTMAANSNANANTNAFRSEPQLLQEYRPLVPSVRRDMGEDYWIDPADLEKEQRRIEAQQRQNAERRSSSNNPSAQTISQEKLMTEVKAPYRQNWIGYFSLMVAVLSIIVSQFPELLEPAPITRFPDL